MSKNVALVLLILCSLLFGVTEGFAYGNSAACEAERAYARGDLEEAERLYLSSLKTAEEHLDKSSPDSVQQIVVNLTWLGAINEDRGKYSEAEKLYKRALALREETLGSNHRYVAGSLRVLAKFYQRHEKYSEAESLYKQAITLCKNSPDANTRDLVASLEAYAGFLRKANREREAIELETEAKDIRNEYEK